MSRKDFYKSKIWRNQARYIWLKQQCICADCGKPVYVDGISMYLPKEKRNIGVVHHIKPINDINYQDNELALNEDNLVGVCQDCHAKRHSGKAIKDGYTFDDLGNLIEDFRVERSTPTIKNDNQSAS